MNNPFQNALSTGLAAVRGLAGGTVTYRRGADSVELTAVVGNTRYEAISADGVTLYRRTRDYLLAAADLDFGAGAVKPAKFDQIEEADNSVFRVLPPGDGPPWAWSDPARTQLRVHTTEKG